MHLNHESYEELCVLLASGQGTDEQREALLEHVATCADCASVWEDTRSLSASLFADEKHAPELPVGAAQRFVARAITEGIPLQQRTAKISRKSKIVHPAWIPCAVAAAGMFFALGLLFARVTSNVPQPLPLHVPSVTITPGLARITDPSVLAENEKIQKDLLIVRRELSLLEKMRSEYEKQIQQLQLANSTLRTQLAEAEQKARSLQHNVELANLDTEKLKQSNTQLEAERNVEKATAFVQESEVARLRKQIKRLEDELAEQQELVATAQEAQQLITARKLHLVDVHDADPNGNHEKAFGRIYYAEGQRLVFYAYDLADPRKISKTFYLWGQSKGGSEVVHKLGIFHNEDAKDRRWVLKCDDPDTLAHVNMVFVTIEKKEVEQPGGKRILYAYLGEANHP